MKVKIVDIGNEDAWVHNKKELIGAIGHFDMWGKRKNGWKYGKFTPELPIPCVFDHVYFYAVKCEEVK